MISNALEKGRDFRVKKL